MFSPTELWEKLDHMVKGAPAEKLKGINTEV